MLVKLEELILKDNNIENLAAKTFENIPNLLTLDISNNKINTLAFIESLTKLEVILIYIIVVIRVIKIIF